MTVVSDFWTFLNDPTNRDTLSWIGGSLIAIGGAASAMPKLITRKGKSNKDHPDGSGTPPSVKSQAGRNVTAARGNISHNSSNTATTETGVTGWQLVGVVALMAGLGLIVIPRIGNNVSASDGSIAVGGDVSGSTITTGK